MSMRKVLVVQRSFGRLLSDMGLAVCANFEGAACTISTAMYGIEQNKADLTACAENILLAREAHFPATIADLYDPDAMPENLRAAHEGNDETLERIYIGRRFKNDTERLEKLFELYAKMTAARAKSPSPQPSAITSPKRAEGVKRKAEAEK